MIAFIDDHRAAYGVEPICKVLPIAPSTYYAHVAQRIDASKRSARARRDGELKVEVQRVFAENFGVYGARKVWRQLRREGFSVARCTIERLMASLGLQGVIRGKPARTTSSDKATPCPSDHVNRIDASEVNETRSDRRWMQYPRRPPPHSISLGGFRTPALASVPAAPHVVGVGPASENLHRSGREQKQQLHRYSITSSARARKDSGI